MKTCAWDIRQGKYLYLIKECSSIIVIGNINNDDDKVMMLLIIIIMRIIIKMIIRKLRWWKKILHYKSHYTKNSHRYHPQYVYYVSVYVYISMHVWLHILHIWRILPYNTIRRKHYYSGSLNILLCSLFGILLTITLFFSCASSKTPTCELSHSFHPSILEWMLFHAKQNIALVWHSWWWK